MIVKSHAEFKESVGEHGLRVEKKWYKQKKIADFENLAWTGLGLHH